MITIFLLVILTIGIDVKCAINFDNATAVLNTYIFKTIMIGKIKILLHNSYFYIKIGNHPYRKMKYNFGVKNKKLPPFPKITFTKLRITSVVGNKNDAISTTILWGITATITNYIKELLEKNVNIKKVESINIPIYTETTSKIATYFTIKYSIIKILFYYLRTIKLSRKKRGVKNAN